MNLNDNNNCRGVKEEIRGFFKKYFFSLFEVFFIWVYFDEYWLKC